MLPELIGGGGNTANKGPKSLNNGQEPPPDQGRTRGKTTSSFLWGVAPDLATKGVLAPDPRIVLLKGFIVPDWRGSLVFDQVCKNPPATVFQTHILNTFPYTHKWERESRQ